MNALRVSNNSLHQHYHSHQGQISTDNSQVCRNEKKTRQVTHNHGTHMHTKGIQQQDRHQYHSRYSGNQKTTSKVTNKTEKSTCNEVKEGRYIQGESRFVTVEPNQRVVKTTESYYVGEPRIVSERIIYDTEGYEKENIVNEDNSRYNNGHQVIAYDQGIAIDRYENGPVITTTKGNSTIISKNIGERKLVEVIEGEPVLTYKSTSEIRTPIVEGSKKSSDSKKVIKEKGSYEELSNVQMVTTGEYVESEMIESSHVYDTRMDYDVSEIEEEHDSECE